MSKPTCESRSGAARRIYLAIWTECLLFCVIQLLIVPAIIFGDSWISDASGLSLRIAKIVQWGVQNYPAAFSIMNLLLIPLMVSVFISRAGLGIRPSRLEVGLMMSVLTLLLPFQVGIFFAFVVS